MRPEQRVELIVKAVMLLRAEGHEANPADEVGKRYSEMPGFFRGWADVIAIYSDGKITAIKLSKAEPAKIFARRIATTPARKDKAMQIARLWLKGKNAMEHWLFTESGDFVRTPI